MFFRMFICLLVMMLTLVTDGAKEVPKYPDQCANELSICIDQSTTELQSFCCCNPPWLMCRKHLQCDSIKSRTDDSCRYLQSHERHFKKYKPKDCNTTYTCNRNRSHWLQPSAMFASVSIAAILFLLYK